MNDHNETMALNRQEQLARDEDNKIDLEETGISGSPSGWVPPGPPEDWSGYRPMFDAPKQWAVDNPGG